MERNTGGRPRLPDNAIRRQRSIRVEDDLWDPFVALVGDGNVSAEFRRYIAERLGLPADEERAA